jgi:hypothetical protein
MDLSSNNPSPEHFELNYKVIHDAHQKHFSTSIQGHSPTLDGLMADVLTNPQTGLARVNSRAFLAVTNLANMHDREFQPRQSDPCTAAGAVIQAARIANLAYVWHIGNNPYPIYTEEVERAAELPEPRTLASDVYNKDRPDFVLSDHNQRVLELLLLKSPDNDAALKVAIEDTEAWRQSAGLVLRLAQLSEFYRISE